MSSERINSILFKPLIFVTGKGGVGKSTVAAAVASGLAQQGRRVLLVELESAGFLGKIFQVDTVSFKPRQVLPNLDLVFWDYLSCLKEYVSFYVKIKSLVEVFFSNTIVQKFLQAAPTLKELALLGKATSQPRSVGPQLSYDHIVIDSYSTGHHQALLKAPFGMASVVHKGPMGFHSQKMIEVLQDSNYTQHLIILKPEEMPIVEGLELKKKLEEEFRLRVDFICNQIMEYPSITNNQDFDLDRYIFSQKQSQERNMKSLSEGTFYKVKFHFNRVDKIAFLNKVFKNLTEIQS